MLWWHIWQVWSSHGLYLGQDQTSLMCHPSTKKVTAQLGIYHTQIQPRQVVTIS